MPDELQTPQQTPQTTPRILIVEDEKDYRDILTERLKAEKYEVLETTNGEQAINLLKNTSVDLILLDMLMPEMDGATFFYHLRNTLKKEVPVIIITNFTETAYPEGVTDFIIKSNTSLEEVITKIKSYLVKP